MDNQHRQIKGYRELSQDEVDLMNEIKTLGIDMGNLVTKVITTNQSAHEVGSSSSYDPEAHRWACIAKTHLQQGVMALTRAVTKPGFF